MGVSNSNPSRSLTTVYGLPWLELAWYDVNKTAELKTEIKVTVNKMDFQDQETRCNKHQQLDIRRLFCYIHFVYFVFFEAHILKAILSARCMLGVYAWAPPGEFD